MATRKALAPWLALGALTLAASLVYWLFDALPFQDLPAHAGLIAIRHRFATSPFEQRFFVLDPHLGPYSLFRFLGDALGAALGPMGAVRAIAMLPGIAMPAALLFARARLHGDTAPAVGYLGVSLSLGLMTLFGLASYMLGIAILIFGLTLWLDLLARPDHRDHARSLDAIVAGVATLLLVAHGGAYVLFVLLAAVACLAAGSWPAIARRAVRLGALVPSLLLAAWMAWTERASITPAGSVPLASHDPPARFQGLTDKLSLLVTPTLMTRTGVDLLAGLLVWAIVVGAAVATIKELRRARPLSDATGDVSRQHSRALYAGAASLLLVFLVLPHAIGWFGFVDGRLVPLVLMLGAMAYRRETLTPLFRAGIDGGLPLTACVMTSLAFFASSRFQDEARGYREVLAEVPAGTRLLNLPLDPNSAVFTAHPFIHYDKLVMVERPVVVSDIWFHQGSALYPTAENPALRLPPTYRGSNLPTIDWPSYRLEDWDYALIRTSVSAPAPYTPAALSLVRHEGGWWLFKVAP
jgi:hypothetical protein